MPNIILKKLFNEDGTLHSTSQIISNKKQVTFKKWGVINLMTELFAILETGENLTKTCYQVLFYCIKILDYENRVVLNKSKCAKEIKVSPRLVYESVSTLIKQGFLIPSKEKIGNIQVYHFNPTMIYVGEGKKQSEITSNILMGEF